MCTPTKTNAIKKKIGDFFKVKGKKVPYRNDNQKNNTYPKI